MLSSTLPLAVVGATVVGATVVGATVVGTTVVGFAVGFNVGATVVDATVVGATVVGATVGFAVGATVTSVGFAVEGSGAFVVAGCPLPAYVYLIDVITDVLFPFTAAIPIAYSPEPFVNTDSFKLTEPSTTLATKVPSTYTLYESIPSALAHAK